MSDHLLQGREGINIRRGKMKNPLHEKMVEQKRIEENRAETISLVSLVLKILENELSLVLLPHISKLTFNQRLYISILKFSS